MSTGESGPKRPSFSEFDLDAAINAYASIYRQRRRRAAIAQCVSAAVLLTASATAIATGVRVLGEKTDLFNNEPATEQELEARIDDLADDLAGQNVDVDCQDINQDKLETQGSLILGYYASTEQNPDLDRPLIAYDYLTCYAVMAYSEDNALADASIGRSETLLSFARHGVLAIGHELTHATGVSDESDAQCGAIALYDKVSELLTMEPVVSLADPRLLAEDPMYPLEYFPADC